MRRLLLATLLCASLAGAASFTLEQVLSAPFPSELIAAPGGGKVAWLLNERGARNIWVASAPEWKGVRVTHYTQDDGTDIGQLHWTADARAVVYTRGGDLEFLGRPDPNPSTNTAGTEQDIMIVVPGEAPRKIAEGHTPEVSPKGDRVVFLRGGQLWVAPLAGGNAELLFHPRSGVTSANPVFSPDGSKLAFVSERVNHSFIAVYDFAARTLSYMDPSVDRDSNPAWSPDGRSRSCAFFRAAADAAEPAAPAGAAKASPGPSASPQSRTAPAARSGAPTPAPAACSTRSSWSTSSSGAPATASSSPGRKTAGRTSIPSRSKAAEPRC